MGFSEELAGLYARDLAKLRAQIELFPNDEALWKTLAGVVNPAGNLVLHLEGNLREYVGRVLGGVAYARDRPLEFSARGLTKGELVRRVAEVERMIPGVVAGLSDEAMAEAYPGDGNGEGYEYAEISGASVWASWVAPGADRFFEKDYGGTKQGVSGIREGCLLWGIAVVRVC